jgi:glycosyltransferase involved in cell wall biosynthesis
MVQRARPGVRSGSVLDVIITFEDTVLPQLLLSPFVGEIVHFPIDKDYSDIVGDNVVSSRFFNLSRCDLIVSTTDHESIKWSMLGLALQVSTVYAPVIAAIPSALTPTASSRRVSFADTISSSSTAHYEEKIHEIRRTPRPYFVTLAWYPTFADVLMAVEACSIFLSSHQAAPTEQSEPEEDGCTGSARLTTLPRLVIAGVDLDNYLLLLREINRLKLRENEDVVVVDSNCPSSLVCELMEASVGLIHTPGEVNQVRIPCAGMLAARPVITTVSFSQSEPVRHESTGVLVKARSPHVIAQTIDNMFAMFVNRQAEWTRQGLRGRQRVVTEFSIEMFGSRLDDVLELRFRNRTGIPMGSPAALPVVTRTRSASGSARAVSIQSGLNELASTAAIFED